MPYGETAPKARHLVATAVRPWVQSRDELRPARAGILVFPVEYRTFSTRNVFLQCQGLTAVATK